MKRRAVSAAIPAAEEQEEPRAARLLPQQTGSVHVRTKAISLMTKIMYQCRPEKTTTMAQCRCCHAPSPGGMECARCLTGRLGDTIHNRGAAFGWLESFRRVQQDEAHVFECAKRADVASP